MTAIFILVPISLLIATGALLTYIVACRTGQFDDLEGPGERLIFDDKVVHSVEEFEIIGGGCNER